VTHKHQRAALKLQQLKKKEMIESDKATEEKISSAVSGRTAVAVQVSFACVFGLF
jgi:hypothetical protein